MDPERRSSLVAAGAFVLTSALLVSFEGDAGSAATSRLYLHSAQAEARLHRAARGIMGDEATGTLPDPFADPEALVAGLHGVGVEDRGELLYSLAAASAAAGGLETARLLASRAGTPPEALLPLRFAWRDDSPVPADRAGLEEALDAAGLSAWSRLHLEALWLERTGDPALAEALRSELDAGDRAWIRRLGAAFTVLLLLGLTGALLLVLHRRLLRRWSEARPAFLQARFGTEPWETFVLFLLWFIGSQALGAALAHALRDVLPGGILILAVYLAGAVLGVLLLALFGIRGFRRSALSREVTGPGIAGLLSMAGLGLKDLSLRTVVWGAGGFAAALPVVWVLALLGLVLVGGDTHPAIPVFVTSESAADRWVLVGTVCLVAPVFEELMFRGFLWNRFQKMLGPYSGTALSALVFSAVHLSLGSFLPLLGLGIILALVARHAGSLWASVVTHSLWNLMNLAVLELLYR